MTSDCALSFCRNPATTKVAFTSDRGTLSSLSCGEHISRCIDRLLDACHGDEVLKLTDLGTGESTNDHTVRSLLSRHGGSID